MTPKAADAASKLDFTEKSFLRKAKKTQTQNYTTSMRYENLILKKNFSFIYQWEYTGM